MLCLAWLWIVTKQKLNANNTGKVPYFFGYKTEFFPYKTIPKI